MANNIKKDYLWNTIGVFAQNATSPLLLVAITRITGINDSGLFSFAFSIAIVFWSLGMWGGRTYQVSDVKAEFRHKSYIVMRLALTVVMFIGALIFSIVNNYDPAKTLIILTLVGLKAFESIADSIYGVLQVNDRLYVAGKSLTYKAAIGLLGFVLVYFFTKDLLMASLVILLINALIVFIYDIPKAMRVEDIYIKPNQLKEHLSESLVIMKRCSAIFVISFLAIFSLNIPRYFIDLFHGSEIGYFGILAMPITLIVLLMSFILQPNIVGLSRMYAHKKFDQFKLTIRNISLITLGISLLTIVGAYVVGIQLLDLVFGLKFESYKLVLIIMLVGATANAYVAIFMNMLTIMRRFKAQFYVLLITNIVLAILSATLIGPYGILVGTSLYMASNIVQATLLYIMFNNYMREAENA